MSIFSKQKNILFISKKHVRAARVVFGRKEIVTVLDESAWTLETLPETLIRFRKKIGRDVRIVLGEDLAYVVSFPLKGDAVYDRAIIKEEAQGLIPENLDEVAWDFQSITAIIGDKRSNISKGVQVMAVAGLFVHEIAPLIAQAGFIVEVIESESTALARMMHSSLEPVVVVWADGERHVLVALERGVVVATQSKFGVVDSDHIRTFIESVNKQFSLLIASVVFSQESAALFESMKHALEKEEYHTRLSMIHPFVGVVKKIDIEGDDADVLNVNILPLKAKKILGLSLRTRERYLLKMFVSMCLIGSIVVVGVFAVKRKLFQGKSPVVVTATAPVSVPVIEQSKPAEVVTETALVVTPEFTAPSTVTILNGSGVTGEAARVGSLLQNITLVVSRVGNADNNQYATTHIRMKAHVAPSIQETVIASLSAVYVCEPMEILDDAAENDIMIIIGKKKK